MEPYKVLTGQLGIYRVPTEGTYQVLLDSQVTVQTTYAVNTGYYEVCTEY